MNCSSMKRKLVVSILSHNKSLAVTGPFVIKLLFAHKRSDFICASDHVNYSFF